ncbi:MAG: histidine kinase [Sediminibacterium sp.]|nr:histidine kinase [Sediminibacterium sp.]
MKMRVYSIIFFFFLFIWAYNFKAQEVYFKNVSDELNLPSEECYNVVQDKWGYIWIATERGVLKISGTNVTTYNSRNSVFDGGVYGIMKARDSSLLFLTSKRTILRGKNDTLEIVAKLDDIIEKNKLQSIRSNMSEILYAMKETLDGKLFVTGSSSSYLLEPQSNNIHRLTKESKDTDRPLYNVYITDKGAYFIKPYKFTERELTKSNWKVKVEVTKGRNKKKIEVDLDNTRLASGIRRIAYIKDHTFFAVDNQLLIIDPDLNYKIATFPTTIISLHGDRSNGLWVGLATKGGRYFKSGTAIDHSKPTKMVLPGLSVSGFCEDKEGNMWCTTLEKGVYFSMNTDVMRYPESVLPEKKAYYIKNINGRIYTSSEWNELMIINGEKIERICLSKKEAIDYSDIDFFENHLCIAMTGVADIYDSQLNYKLSLKDPNTKSSVTLYDLDKRDGKLYGISKSAIYEVDKDFQTSILTSFNSRGRCLNVVNDKYLLYGCSNGIYKYTFSTGTSEKLPGIDVQVTKIERVGPFIAVSTRGQGLGFIRNDSVILQRFKILPDDINDLATDKNGVLWIASNYGIYKYDISAGNAQQISKVPGLPSSNINKIAIADSVLFASSYNGLFRFSIVGGRSQEYIPDIRLRSISVNKLARKQVGHTLVLPYYQNTIDMVFDIFTFRKDDYSGMYYKLEPYDTAFYFSKDGKISYQNLPPGKYLFYSYTTNFTGTGKRNQYSLEITIEMPFWKEIWFIVLLMLIGGGVVYGIIRVVIKRVKRREAEKFLWEKRLSDSQLSALQSQMNPHFIFNAINSIQNYILDKDEKQAYDYLAKFSRLIRKVLNNSRQRKISLSDEMETLQLYVEMEQLRFENAFEYRQSVNPKLYPDGVFIPTMIIQPYVENAIWHGLNSLKGERRGELVVTVDVTAPLPESGESEIYFLYVVIDDNGIGREKASAYKASNTHKPAGMIITKERMELVNKLQGNRISNIKITDKYNEAGEANGTKVELWIKIEEYDDEWTN